MRRGGRLRIAPRQLDQRQRVAVGGAQQPVERITGGCGRELLEEVCRSVPVQPSQLDLRPARREKWRVVAFAQGDQDGYWVGHQPAGSKGDGLGRCRVQPVRVVHCQQQRSVLGV